MVKYTYDGADLLFENDDNDAVQIRYLYGPGIDHILESVDSVGTKQHFADALGSVSKITDSTGTILKKLTYDSFGNVRADSGSVIADDVTYTGREHESALGIYYYRARYYDPLTGRFMVRDPLGLSAGDVNLYRYVGNNPINYGDAMGLRIDWNSKNPSNPLVRENLENFNQGIIAQGYPDESFTIYVTTVDRYEDLFGQHIGVDTGDLIPDSDPESPHLLSRGARAVDFALLGINVSDSEKRKIVDKAIKSHTCFLPDNTEPKDSPAYKNKGHIHIALPYSAPYIMPFYGPYNLPEKPIDMYFRNSLR